MKEAEVTLVGAGIMSATLAVFLKELNPNVTINIYERLNQAALESSDAWNNAGTGHSAFCELNYTTLNEKGEIECQKAVHIAEQFLLSRQFWSYLVENDKITSPDNFIHSVPHLSFVWGSENVSYLKKRYEALVKNTLFSDMQFSTNKKQLNDWMPLVMENRNTDEELAATYMNKGTDVNFGALTRSLFDYLEKQNNVAIYYNHEVKKLEQNDDSSWRLKINETLKDETFKTNSKFVFLGAGGGALLLLEKADIDESEGFGGFPVSGQWLKCNNPKIIEKHHVKVYGKANVGAPPMSVPHLDSRNIDGKKELLFGPFAGFSTKFLKNGSYLDLIKSLELDNIFPMLSAGWQNIPLVEYLIKEVLQSDDDRLEALKKYFPNAKKEDWVLLEAGQRVQIIKKDKIKGGGNLEFGTELISSKDNTLTALLGASPGASTAVAIMSQLLEDCFQDELKTDDWHKKLKEMIPSYGISLNENPELAHKIAKETSKTLNLKF